MASIREIEVLVKEYDGQLKCDDPRFQHEVRIFLDDGSSFHWDSAFAARWLDDGDGEENLDEGWFVVFTEHHRFHVFHASDVLRVEQYARLGIEDIGPGVRPPKGKAPSRLDRINDACGPEGLLDVVLAEIDQGYLLGQGREMQALTKRLRTWSSSSDWGCLNKKEGEA